MYIVHLTTYMHHTSHYRSQCAWIVPTLLLQQTYQDITLYCNYIEPFMYSHVSTENCVRHMK